jgi:teichuronic acid exporter
LINNILNKLKNPSEYAKNITAIAGSSLIAQLLPIITAPILTRIYEPADYGTLNILMSLITMVATVATLGYLNGIIIAKDDEEANALAAMCFKSLLYATVIVAVLVFIFYNYIAKAYQLNSGKALILTLPIFLIMNGITGIFTNLATRHKHFGTISKNRVWTVVISTVVSISIGFYTRNYWGLLIGFFVGQFIASAVLYFWLSKKKAMPSIAQLLKIPTKTVAKQHINFPKYVMPSDFINMFSNQIPVFAISRYDATPQTSLGHYNMSNRMLGIPISLISGSIAEVFRQRSAQDYYAHGTCRPIFIKTFKALLATAIVPFTILIIFGADIFAFVFGEKWREAGSYSQILGFLFFFRFVISPLTYVFYVAGKQRLDFILHLLFIVIGFLTLYIGLVKYNSITTSLWLFTIGYCIIYLIYFFYSLKISKKHVI